MKENTKNLIARLSGWITLAVVIMFAVQTGQAQTVVFDNTQKLGGGIDPTTVNGNTQYVTDTNEFGDTIVLANLPGGATGVVLTNFELQVYHTTNILGTATMELKFYANDGAAYGTNYNVPKSVIYDSGVQSLKGLVYKKNTVTTNTVNSLTFDNGASGTKLNVWVPASFTWTVTVSNLGLATVGLVEFDAGNTPYIGTDYADYWQATTSGVNVNGWQDLTNSTGVPVNFGTIATGATAGITGSIASVKIGSPKAKAINNTEVVTVSGSIKLNPGNDAVQFVQVWDSEHTNIVVPETTGKGVITFSGALDLGAAGTKNIYVTAVDANNASVTATNIETFAVYTNLTVNVNGGQPNANLVVPKPGTLLIDSTNGNGTQIVAEVDGLQIANVKPYTLIISEPTNHAFFLTSVVVSTNGVAGPGLTYNITKAPLKLAYTMQTNLVVDANYATNLCEDGAYYGLFAVNSNAPAFTNAGSFSLAVSRTKRTFTGVLNVNGYTGVKIGPGGKGGVFGFDGSASVTATNGSDTYIINLQLPPYGTHTIGGTVSNANAGWTAILDGDFTGGKSGGNAIAYAGNYTMVVPGGGTASASSPGGDTIGTVAVNGLGGVTLGGFFGDSAKTAQILKQSVYIGQTGRWGLFSQGYSVGSRPNIIQYGFLWGWMTIGTASSPSLTNLSPVTWMLTSPGVGGYTHYTIITNVIASPFTNSAPNLIGLAGGIGSAQIGGAEYVSPLTVTNIHETGTTYTIPLGMPQYKLIIKAGKGGLISGTFTNAVGLPKTTYSYNGVVLQNKSQARGQFFDINDNQAGFILIH